MCRNLVTMPVNEICIIGTPNLNKFLETISLVSLGQRSGSEKPTIIKIRIDISHMALKIINF